MSKVSCIATVSKLCLKFFPFLFLAQNLNLSKKNSADWFSNTSLALTFEVHQEQEFPGVALSNSFNIAFFFRLKDSLSPLKRSCVVYRDCREKSFFLSRDFGIKNLLPRIRENSERLKFFY